MSEANGSSKLGEQDCESRLATTGSRVAARRFTAEAGAESDE
jgi:hypothetical protein